MPFHRSVTLMALPLFFCSLTIVLLPSLSLCLAPCSSVVLYRFPHSRALLSCPRPLVLSSCTFPVACSLTGLLSLAHVVPKCSTSSLFPPRTRLVAMLAHALLISSLPQLGMGGGTLVGGHFVSLYGPFFPLVTWGAGGVVAVVMVIAAFPRLRVHY